jgi:hypothetical protein
MTFLGLVPADLDRLFVTVHLPPNGGGGLVFRTFWTTLSQLVMELSWDNETPGSSDFNLRHRNKSARAISGKKSA